jgi:hypothetical protein
MSQRVLRELAAEVRETVPQAPGVYAFFDAEGRLLYIGKSVHLRRRVASYFHRNPLTAESRLGQLVTNVRGFAWWQTSSELLALLLEDVMIKEYMPPLNRRQREFQENCYLELSGGNFPACLIVEHADGFAEREVYGPLKDKYFATALRDILHEALGIRSCSDREPVERCLEYDIRRCTGPCRGAIDITDYQHLVELATAFLRGDAGGVVARLETARDRAAQDRRFEEAARLRDAIVTCGRYEARQRFARRFTQGDCELRSEEDGLVYRFSRGALLAPHSVVTTGGRGGTMAESTPGTPSHDLGPRAFSILSRRPGDPRLLADRAAIVHSWLTRRKTCELRFASTRTRVAELQLGHSESE